MTGLDQGGDMVRTIKTFHAARYLLLAAAGTAYAAAPNHSYNIPAEDLGRALRAFADQSGEHFVVSANLVAGRNSPSVDGVMSEQDALSRLLGGSGLHADRISGAYVIRADPADTGTTDHDTDIVVTGTRIRGSAPIGSPVTTIDRQAIEESGRATLADLVQTIPQNFGGGQTEATEGGNAAQSFAQTNTGFGTSINLRGLGASSTLTLLDGSRPALGGDRASFADVSLIPAIAIDRIEIMTDGASSIYGSDAVAGVVNLRFRDRFEGVEARFFGGTADGDFGQQQASLIAGKRWSTGGIVAAYEYDHRGALPASDRGYATEDLTRYGGPDNRSGYTLPATLFSSDGSLYSATRIGTPDDPLTADDLVPGAINKRDDVRLTYLTGSS